MRWNLKPLPNSNTVEKLKKELGVNDVIATLLAQRGVSSYIEAKAFFRPNLNALYDPFLMKDMDKAVTRVLKALDNNENILVYGDYDVDGTTSVALMYSFLKTHTQNVAYYIPDRYTEGYGVSYQGIDFAADNEMSLIIALDCGIKAIDKVDYANKKGVDFIICDHHRPADNIPNAVAVLDPKQKDCQYPFKELCGCGVGFKLISAITKQKGVAIETIYPYLDLVATAIAADIVPIVDENRILAYHGVNCINSSPRPGILALMKETKKSHFTITDVVFTLAPRINAAGRMKHGNYAVSLLVEEDLEVANSYASEINEFNTDRRATDKQITQEALEQIKVNTETEKKTTVVYNEHWHKGVIGIVASRLIETYYRPTLVFTKSGDKLAASARSVSGFDVYNALEACSDLIEQFGGHKYAAGLTLKEENYEAFKDKFESVVKETIDPKLLTPELKIDLPIALNQIDDKLNRILKQFAPFGPGNMSPVFMTQGVLDSGYSKCVGEDDKHLRLTLTDKKGSNFTGIGFNLGKKETLVKNGSPFDISYAVEENEWNGNISLQLKVKDIKQ